MNSPALSQQLPEKYDAHMSGDIEVANAKIVLNDQVVLGSIEIEDGIIVAINEGGAVRSGAIDFRGDFVIPGLVELHTDNLERHIEPRPGVPFPHKTAILAHDGELASAGITTVFDALRVGSLTDSKTNYGKYARQVASEILELRDEGILRIRHMLHLRAEVCSDTLVEELSEFGPDDRVRLVSLMDHTPGQRQFRDVSKLKDYIVGKYGYTDEQFAEHILEQKERGDRNRDRHERATIDHAKLFGATLASHDDTTTGQVKKSKSIGINLAEFPTTLEAAQACRDQGIQIIMGAPNLLRGGSHSGNVAAAELAKHDLLDIVSSDYVPSALLNSAFKLADIWDDLPRAIKTVTQSPANATDLIDRGKIEVGCYGDLVRVRKHKLIPIISGVWRGGVQVG
jgi:alpha-D-ribose 1-methylphosphonate 5-triphosphate diphosphatase